MRVLFIRVERDDNIAHFLFNEILHIWSVVAELRKFDSQIAVDVLFEGHDEGKQSNRWRRELLLACGFSVHYSSSNLPIGLYKNIYKISPTQSLVEVSRFLSYSRYLEFTGFVSRVLDALQVESTEETDILLVCRSKSRVLLDSQGGGLLSERLGVFSSAASLRLAVVNLDGLTLREQAAHFNSAKTVIAAHGAELTNLIFMKAGTRIIEINFRGLWTCDPLCDGHFEGVLRPGERCEGGLRYFPHFHKADFHNLCGVFGVNHIEVSASGCGEYLDRNPINTKALFVRSGELLSLI